MANNNKLIIAVSFFAISLVAFAQKGNTTANRLAWDKGLSLLENYEISSAVSDQDAYYDFISLFPNGDVLIYNDLLGSASGNPIKVTDYANFQLNQAKSKQVFVSNIKKKRIWDEGNLTKMEYEFDKAISYANNNGIYFDTNDFYGDNYKMTAIIAYDPETQTGYIEKLDGTINSDKKLPADFYTFIKRDERDKDLKFNSSKVVTNRFGQAFLTGNVTKKSFSYTDPDVSVSPAIDEATRTVTTTYKARRITIKPHYDIAFGEPLKCGDSDWLTNIKSKETLCVGLDLGYTIPSKSKFKVGVFLGVEYSQLKLDMDYSNPDYSYYSYADVDGDSYYRHYRDLALTQSVKLTQIGIPVYADFSMRFGRVFGIYLDLGVKMNLNASINNTASGSAYIYGIYPQYNDLYLDGQWGYNNFGDMTYSDANLVDPQLPDVNKFTADLLGGLGVRVNIPSTQLAFNIGVNFQMGLMPLIKESDRIGDPIVYNEIFRSSSTEKLNSLTQNLGDVKTQMIKLSIGLSYKF